VLFNFDQVLNLSTATLLALHCSGCPSTITHLWSLSLWHWLGAQRPQLQHPNVHRLSYPCPRFSPLLSLVRALLASAEARRVCGSGSAALIAGVAPQRRVWPVVHGRGALSPFSPSSSLSSLSSLYVYLPSDIMMLYWGDCL